MSSQKCLSQEFQALEDANTPTKAAKVHGVLTHISPMKGKYYEAYISDETTSKQLVGFHKEQRDQLADFQEQPVTLDNCTISDQNILMIYKLF